jgi:hypothetical protein
MDDRIIVLKVIFILFQNREGIGTSMTGFVRRSIAEALVGYNKVGWVG